jgi:hypothetical protein
MAEVNSLLIVVNSGKAHTFVFEMGMRDERIRRIL